MDSGFNIIGGPPRRILKESDASDASVIAKIEPMLHAARHIDHVASFNGHTEDRAVFRMEVKHAPPLDRESDFVLRMRMLLVELSEHCIEVRSVRVDIDHIGCDKTTGSFNLIDFRSILSQDLRIRRTRFEPTFNFPTLIPDPKRLQELEDLIGLGQIAVLVGNVNDCHDGRWGWSYSGLSVGERTIRYTRSRYAELPCRSVAIREYTRIGRIVTRLLAYQLSIPRRQISLHQIL